MPEKSSTELIAKQILARIPTGISGLDEHLRGGFPRGSMVLLTGPPGTGKSIFAAQFLLKGLELGDGAVLVDTCHAAEAFPQYAADFGWDRRLIEKVHVLDCFNFRIGEKDLHTVDITSFGEVAVTISQLLEEGKGPVATGARLVVDTFSDFVLYNSLERSLKFLQTLKASLKRHQNNLISTLLILESGSHDENIVQAIEYSADATIKMMGDERGRFCMVSRMRSTPTSYSWIPLRISKGLGVGVI